MVVRLAGDCAGGSPGDRPAQGRVRAGYPLKVGIHEEGEECGWGSLSRGVEEGLGRGALHGRPCRSEGDPGRASATVALLPSWDWLETWPFLSFSRASVIGRLLPTAHSNLESNSHLRFLSGAVLGSCVCRNPRFIDMYLHLPLVQGAISALVCTGVMCGLAKLESESGLALRFSAGLGT